MWYLLSLQSKGFFRGMSWPLASFAFVNSAYFGAYGHVLSWFEHHQRTQESPHRLQVFTAGLVATFPTGFIACPIDVIKVTLQAQIQHDPHLPPSRGQYLFAMVTVSLSHACVHTPILQFFLNHNGALIFKYIQKNKIKLHNFFFSLCLYFAIINHHHSSNHKYTSHYRSTIQTSPQVI